MACCMRLRSLAAARLAFLCVLAVRLSLGGAAPSRNLIKVTATRSRSVAASAGSECAPAAPPR